MKKFYAIFSALMLLFSVSAYSQLQTPRQLKMKQLKEQVRQKHDKHALMDFGKLAKSPVKSPRLAAKARLTKGKTVKNAESIDVTITNVFTVYDPETKTVWYSLSPDSWSPSFSFSIYVPDGKRDIELGKTYTFADMEHDEDYNPNYWTDDEWVDHPIVEATFTKTIGEGYDMHIAATATHLLFNTTRSPLR